MRCRTVEALLWASRTYSEVPKTFPERKKNKIHDRISRRLHIEKDKYLLVPHEKMVDYEKKINVERPTTGTSSILWSLENFNKIIIHGFDFFIDSKSHYNDNKITKLLIDWGIIKKGGKHDMEKEKEYIESLIKEKKVVLLKDHLN